MRGAMARVEPWMIQDDWVFVRLVIPLAVSDNYSVRRSASIVESRCLMLSHHAKATVAADGSMKLDAVPFPAGEPVDVLVWPSRSAPGYLEKLAKYGSAEFTKALTEAFHAAKRDALDEPSDDLTAKDDARQQPRRE
ncbi:MAG: hypothetical protein HYS13_21405 [Planctomycetia bacterium]|nr:hypothetical protein [Planctomycetia bacterium]